jgi:hypothetical protein
MYEVLKAVDTYPGSDGQEKTEWLKCGVVFKSEKTGKLSMKLKALPLVDMAEGLWFVLKPPEPYQPKEKQQGSREQSQRGADGFEDTDIPDF